MLPSNPRLSSIEWARLEGQRPRSAGSNARLDPHGRTFSVPLARLTTDDGLTGLGVCGPTPEQARGLLGARLGDLFSVEQGPTAAARAIEFPLWDLAGQLAGRPVYALVAQRAGLPPPQAYRVNCYDTSLYFDDLGLASDAEAAELMGAEAREGYSRGHRAFKLKVGRGARHMPLEAGTRRDVAVVRAVRAAVGPGVPLLVDANNGYNLNLAKRVLEETAGCGVYWLEEPFYEDPVLYRDLREWLQARGLNILIADGEGQPAPQLGEWARAGLVDVLQYDLYSLGFSGWLSTGAQLDAWGVRSAPHHYATYFGNFAACHLAVGIRNFAFVEWDEARTLGLESAGYAIEAGQVVVPDTPGFGLQLDDALFRRAVAANGFRESI